MFFQFSFYLFMSLSYYYVIIFNAKIFSYLLRLNGGGSLDCSVLIILFTVI